MKLLVEHFEGKISELASTSELNMSVRSGVTKATASNKGGKASTKAKQGKDNESEQILSKIKRVILGPIQSKNAHGEENEKVVCYEKFKTMVSSGEFDRDSRVYQVTGKENDHRLAFDADRNSPAKKISLKVEEVD